MKYICWLQDVVGVVEVHRADGLFSQTYLLFKAHTCWRDVLALGLTRRGHLFAGDDSVLSVLTSALCHWDSHQG